MKIISKYKDFYDSFGFTLGKPDESVCYIRTPQNINYNDKDYSKQLEYLSKYNINSHIFNIRQNNKKFKYNANILCLVIGIYPYIYISPFYIINDNQYTFGIRDLKPIPLMEDIVKDKDYHEIIYDEIQEIFDEYVKTHKINGKLYINDIYTSPYSSAYDIERKPWVIEDRNIFKELNVPTFIYIPTYFNHINNEFLNYYTTKLILNPIFNNFPFNVLGYHKENIVNERNVYIDIENFLWEMKKEPISEPDNKTKIISHGFDLKTSFRNIK